MYTLCTWHYINWHAHFQARIPVRVIEFTFRRSWGKWFVKTHFSGVFSSSRTPFHADAITWSPKLMSSKQNKISLIKPPDILARFTPRTLIHLLGQLCFSFHDQCQGFGVFDSVFPRVSHLKTRVPHRKCWVGFGIETDESVVKESVWPNWASNQRRRVEGAICYRYTFTDLIEIIALL